MKFNEETYHLIDQYILGQLHGKELDSFEKRVAQDDALRTEVELAKLANQLIFYNEAVDLKAQMKSDFSQMRKVKTRNRVIGISLLLITIIGAYFFFYQEKGKSNTKKVIPNDKIPVSNSRVNSEIKNPKKGTRRATSTNP